MMVNYNDLPEMNGITQFIEKYGNMPTEDDVWELCKNSENIPNFTAVYVELLTNNFENAISNYFLNNDGLTELKETFDENTIQQMLDNHELQSLVEIPVECYFNYLDTHFNVNNVEFTTLSLDEIKEELNNQVIQNLQNKLFIYDDLPDIDNVETFITTHCRLPSEEQIIQHSKKFNYNQTDAHLDLLKNALKNAIDNYCNNEMVLNHLENKYDTQSIDYLVTNGIFGDILDEEIHISVNENNDLLLNNVNITDYNLTGTPLSIAEIQELVIDELSPKIEQAIDNISLKNHQKLANI